MVEPKLDILLVQLLTFLLAVPLLWSFFISKLMKTLEKRDAYIRENIEKAEKDRAAMEQLKADYEKSVKQMHAQTLEALGKAAADGEKTKAEMIETAKKEGHALIVEAKKEIELEKVKAIESVKDKIADLTVRAAEKIIKTKLNKKSQMTLIKKYMKDIEKRVN